MPTANVTMVEKNSKHVARKGANDKRGITVTLGESLSGEILPMQLIYKGKTNRSLPSVKFPAGFALTYNQSDGTKEHDTPIAILRSNHKWCDKKMESRAFSEYFTNCINKELLKDSGKDVTTIDVDLKLSSLKPKHGDVMCDVYNYLKSMKGRSIILSGWKAAGITSTINEGRADVMPTLDPYI